MHDDGVWEDIGYGHDTDRWEGVIDVDCRGMPRTSGGEVHQPDQPHPEANGLREPAESSRPMTPWRCPCCGSVEYCTAADGQCARSAAGWGAVSNVMADVLLELVFDPIRAYTAAMYAGLRCIPAVRSGAAHELEFYGGDW